MCGVGMRELRSSGTGCHFWLYRILWGSPTAGYGASETHTNNTQLISIYKKTININKVRDKKIDHCKIISQKVRKIDISWRILSRNENPTQNTCLNFKKYTTHKVFFTWNSVTTVASTCNYRLVPLAVLIFFFI